MQKKLLVFIQTGSLVTSEQIMHRIIRHSCDGDTYLGDYSEFSWFRAWYDALDKRLLDSNFAAGFIHLNTIYVLGTQDEYSGLAAFGFTPDSMVLD